MRGRLFMERMLGWVMSSSGLGSAKTSSGISGVSEPSLGGCGLPYRMTVECASAPCGAFSGKSVEVIHQGPTLTGDPANPNSWVGIGQSVTVCGMDLILTGVVVCNYANGGPNHVLFYLNLAYQLPNGEWVGCMSVEAIGDITNDPIFLELPGDFYKEPGNLCEGCQECGNSFGSGWTLRLTE